MSRLLQDATFVVVDLETTGVSPSYAEIIEIGAVKVQQGKIIERFHSLIRPHGRIPEEISRITGIHYEMVQDKPVLETVLPDFIDFLGDAIFVAHNAVFDWGFVNHAVKAFRETPLSNQSLCTLKLARKLLPFLHSKGLDGLTAYYELENPARHRAHGDAEVTAEILKIFLQQLQTDVDIQTVEGLFAFQAKGSRSAQRWEGVFPYDANRVKTFPTCPGVYLMKDAEGHILYIGKAKNLKNRVRSYFQQLEGQPRKVLELMRQVHQIDYHVLGSELEALILEAQLIKAEQPFFNRQIKNYKHFPFLKLSMADAYPRLSITEEIDDEEAVYFGPFNRKRSLERALLEGVNRTFQLRSCSDLTFRKHQSSPCLDYHIGLCSAPCTGLVSPETYRQTVKELIAFLEGETSQHLDKLKRKRDAFIERLEFEKAGSVQEQLNKLERLQGQCHRLIKAVHQNNCLIALPAAAVGQYRLFYILQGRPYRIQTFDPFVDSFEAIKDQVQELLPVLHDMKESGRYQPIPKIAFEETRIIARWLQEREDEEGIVISLLEEGLHAQLEELRCSLLEGDAKPMVPEETLFGLI